MFYSVPRNRAAALFLSALLAACGGGGGGTTQAAIQASGNSTAQGSTGQTTSGGGANTGSASSGSGAEASAVAAHFNRPVGVAVDTSGNLYIADSANYTIRKIAPDGTVSTLAGSPGMSGSADGNGTAARFSALHDVAVDGSGNIYAVDNSAIRKITPSGAVTTLAGVSGANGYAEGVGAAARFNQPWGISADTAGNLYVGDTENYVVRRITPAGLVTTFAGTAGVRGGADGTATTATFRGPRGVEVNAAGEVFVTDWFGPPAPNIPEGSTLVRRIASNGTVSTIAGNLGSETAPALFSNTFAITTDAGGNAYVAAMSSVHRISPTGAVTVLVNAAPQFVSLEGVSVDAAGNLYVTDASNHVVSRVAPNGGISPVAGVAGEPGSSDSED